MAVYLLNAKRKCFLLSAEVDLCTQWAYLLCRCVILSLGHLLLICCQDRYLPQGAVLIELPREPQLFNRALSTVAFNFRRGCLLCVSGYKCFKLSSLTFLLLTGFQWSPTFIQANDRQKLKKGTSGFAMKMHCALISSYTKVLFTVGSEFLKPLPQGII